MAVVVGVEHTEHKCMLTFLANGLVSPPLLALLETRRLSREKGADASSLPALAVLSARRRAVMGIALLSGLERNLTNASMYSIGGSLKTALHVFNVLFTFLLAAVAGTDEAARACLLRRRGGCTSGGHCGLVASLCLVLLGGVVIASEALRGHGAGARSPGAGLGVAMQLASGAAHAGRVVVSKLLLSGEDGLPKPSKAQIALVALPATGLSALCLLPFFESTWAPPPANSVFWLGICAVGILVCELRLTELTTPLTVSLVSVVNNMLTVTALVLFEGEFLDTAQCVGFLLSSLGVLTYALSRRRAGAPNGPSVLPVSTSQPLETTADSGAYKLS
eukprot:TRINITY_DN59273_c0_g1_i1.p1 TRINITY_DN59273_c0_g1~~TRINITY_DN59273_c0_g1_i1.p1  ORF type:complete len:381 (-),score=75.95 TRINITY_DN59273_c0_g1_i1:43-1047(-)